MFYKVYLSAFIFCLAGCVHGGCNNVPQRPQNLVVGEGTPSPTPAPAAPVILPKGTVQVYRATGEKQCGMEKGIPIEEMKATLTQGKIKVYEAHTQLDGLMHMALCGSPSGSIHVFAIPKRDLARAKKLGFKLFKPPKTAE